MDKNAIKKYATWAREQLIEKVTAKAVENEIIEGQNFDENLESINGIVLTDTRKKQRKALIQKIKREGYAQVMEEVAYTWFNRFIAIRFMEVNGYLPSHVRVFSDENGNFSPQILSEAIHIEIDGIDINHVMKLKEASDDEELFKYLLIVQCNALNEILPYMFAKIDDYSELLLPDYLLRAGSVVEKLVNEIPEDNFNVNSENGQVEIIGWMYQYYISEPKDNLINARKAYNKSDIPFVTQIFTSEWIVKFMVENSLGNMWLESKPNTDIAKNWKYFVKNRSLNKENKVTVKNPIDIKCIDPCMGSGHIICYLFDVLIQIYQDYGYSSREAAENIVKYNLFGLDIDERAGQLSYFAIMMKARQYDRRFLTKGIQPNVYTIPEIESISNFELDAFCDGKEELRSELKKIISSLENAKTYGSLLKGCKADYNLIYKQFEYLKLVPNLFTEIIEKELWPIVKVSEILSLKYDVVVTNPPYMNSSYMPGVLKEYVQNNYGDYKSDLFATFIVRAIEMCKEQGYIGMLTPYVWMSILSYEKLRETIYSETNITSMVQLEYNAFESACVPVCTFTLKKTTDNYQGEYIKLSEFKGAEVQGPKTLDAIKNPNCGYRYLADQRDFEKVPGAPVAFWVSKNFFGIFSNKKLSDIGEAKKGISTSDNDRFLRYWFEIEYNKLGIGYTSASEFARDHKKWAPMNKGGAYRKWFGNNDYVVNWEFDGNEVKNYKPACIRNEKYYFGESITWTDLTSYKPSFRYNPCGFIHDVAGPCIFSMSSNTKYIMGILNSKVIEKVFEITSPTMHFNIGTTADAPVILDEKYFGKINELVEENIKISKADWDSFETSWDFKKHPLLGKGLYIGDAFKIWETECDERFKKLKKNEEKINEFVIEMYGLEEDVTPEVNDDDITVHKANREREIKSLISYAVGCMYGRYSLDYEGIVYANEVYSKGNNLNYNSTNESIIMISDDEYFEKDLANNFFEFVENAFGKENLERNLQYIADSLGGNGSARAIIRNYLINGFYADHLKIYQKTPIYWLFDAGKKNSFKCIVNMHQYKADMLARIRTDFVHEQQARYRTAISELETKTGVSQGEKVKLDKQLKKLQEQSEELKQYEEKIHHLADQMISIDLDDGVKVNYSKFQEVLAKIK